MTATPSKLNSIAREFVDATELGSIVKTAFIRHLPSGEWGVFSEKGKSLGKYKSKELAKKRLRQIEFFKHKKAAHDNTYSSIMRGLNKDNDNEKMTIFQQVFKDEFDKEYANGNEEPEAPALEAAMKAIANDTYDELLVKTANALDMGDPMYAGKYLAEMIKFLMRRISEGKRQHSIDGLKKKIWYLNEYQIASKRMPVSSAIGQSITLIKHLLLEHTPEYIRAVLNSIVRNL